MAGRSWMLVGVLSLTAICCWCQIHAAAQVYNYVYLEDDCRLNLTIELSDDDLSLYGFVRMARTRYEHDMNCAVTVWAPQYHYLTMRIRRLDTRNCEDYLKIQGSNTSDPLYYCGTGTPSYSISSLTQKLTYEFVSSKNPIEEDRIGFELHYTAFHRDGCGENEFRCKYESRCIPKELTCDSIDNCGDWSDERSGVCGLSTGAIVAICLVCILVTAACVGFGIYYYRDVRKQRERKRARQNAEATVEYVRTPQVAPTSSGYSNGVEPPPPYTYAPTYAMDGKVYLDTNAMYGADMAGAGASAQGYVPNPLYAAPTQDGGDSGAMPQQDGGSPTDQGVDQGVDNPTYYADTADGVSGQNTEAPNIPPPTIDQQP